MTCFPTYLGVHAGEVDEAKTARRAGTVGPGKAVDHHVFAAAERIADEVEDGGGESPHRLGGPVHMSPPRRNVESVVSDLPCHHRSSAASA